MEKAIELLQDHIIYLTGQIVLIEQEYTTKQVKDVMIKTWKDEIEQLKEVQSVISNNL